jgi:hypothetical protein
MEQHTYTEAPLRMGCSVHRIRVKAAQTGPRFKL